MGKNSITSMSKASATDFFSYTAPSIVSSNRILYTAPSFARSSLLHLQEIGELTALRPHSSSRSELSSFLFFIALSGSGVLTYKGESYDLNPFDCVFIDCRRPYSHSTSNDLWTLRWIHFNGPTMSSIYNKYCERGGRAVFRLSANDVERVGEIWTQVINTAGSGSYMRDMLINQHLSELLTLLMEQSWHPEDKAATPKRQSVAEVRRYLEDHYNEKISLDELSSRFFIDKYYLTKSFKEEFGVNISTYQTELRVTKAKQMLRFSESSIEEISESVGISSPEYFNRVFKKIEGLSPSKYRKQW